MLRARSQAAEDQRDDQYGQGRAGAKSQISSPGDSYAGREHNRPTVL
jgi:hypothetical protein